MTASTSESRPYAAATNVIAVLERVRQRNLPDAIDSEFLRLVRIEGESARLTRLALRFLDLTDEEDKPTDKLREMAAASEPDFRDLIKGAVTSAYASDLEAIDPAVDDAETISGWFQRYQPRSTTKRMVSLLLGLLRASGVSVAESAQPPTQRAKATRKPTKKRPKAGKPEETASTIGDQSFPQPSLPASPHVFSVTEADIAGLDEDEFAALWSTLGKLVRNRAQPKGVEGPAEDLHDGNDSNLRAD